MSQFDVYIEAAERVNTRKSYASAVRHFEVEWKGFLPATADTVARYLADHGATLSINTLRHRLAALSRWHADHGFPDPTKAPVVRQVLKGIRTLHPAKERQARPLQLDAVQQVADWLQRAAALARTNGDRSGELRHTRDRSLLLLGFWRGFRSDELVRLQIEHIEVVRGEGLTCYLPRSKGDRMAEGRSFSCPALSRLCPVAAYEAWVALLGLPQGPVFRKLDRWGHVGQNELDPVSIVPLLRRLFSAAGLPDPDDYSSHSLRRGFAGWARSNGWDLRDMMEYVGWRDVKSAMRYLDAGVANLKERFEQGLPPITVPPEVTRHDAGPARLPESPATPIALVRVTLHLTRYSSAVRGLTRAHRLIEQACLERHAMQRLDKAGTEYELSIPCPSRDVLDDTVYALLDDMHRIADDNQCFLEAKVHEPATDTHWE